MADYRIPIYETRLSEVGQASYSTERVQCLEHAVSLAKSITDDLPTERFMVIHLDGQNSLLGVEIVSKGGIHGCAVTVREIYQGALRANASAVILAHNHPSNDPFPSPEDVAMTRKAAEAGRVLGLPVLDHVIVTRRGGSHSLRDTMPEVFE